MSTTAKRRGLVDSNICLYALSGGQDAQNDKAVEAEAGLFADGNILVTEQVYKEVAANIYRKFGMPAKEVVRLLRGLDQAELVPFQTSHVARAILLAEAQTLSFWDALLVQSAIEAQAEEIWSEDLQDGRLFLATRVANPLGT